MMRAAVFVSLLLFAAVVVLMGARRLALDSWRLCDDLCRPHGAS